MKFQPAARRLSSARIQADAAMRRTFPVGCVVMWYRGCREHSSFVVGYLDGDLRLQVSKMFSSRAYALDARNVVKAWAAGPHGRLIYHELGHLPLRPTSRSHSVGSCRPAESPLAP